jgi:predicted SnoaL-like aldol condensation-catalyzing enzyme
MSLSGPPASLEQNKRLLLRWLDEAWNHGRREIFHELFAKTGVYHRGSAEYLGPAGFLHLYDILRGQFSEFSIKPTLTIAESDLVCVHWSLDFVHTKTRAPVQVTGTTICRIKDGQFTEAWQNWDAAGLKAQVPGLFIP